jgi:hypothetical protein
LQEAWRYLVSLHEIFSTNNLMQLTKGYDHTMLVHAAFYQDAAHTSQSQAGTYKLA